MNSIKLILLNSMKPYSYSHSKYSTNGNKTNTQKDNLPDGFNEGRWKYKSPSSGANANCNNVYFPSCGITYGNFSAPLHNIGGSEFDLLSFNKPH